MTRFRNPRRVRRSATITEWWVVVHQIPTRIKPRVHGDGRARSPLPHPPSIWYPTVLPPPVLTHVVCGEGVCFHIRERLQDRSARRGRGSPRWQGAGSGLSSLDKRMETVGGSVGSEIDLLSSVDDSLHFVTSYASISQARKALGCAGLMRTYICGRRLRRLVIYMCRLH